MRDEQKGEPAAATKTYPLWLMGAGIGVGVAVGNGVARGSGSRWIGMAAGAVAAAVFALLLVGAVVLWRRRKARR